MGDLTEHFSLKEFFISHDFPHLIDWVVPSELDRLKCYLLAKTILEPLREKVGPIGILSGKRTEELNNRIGGAKNSDHLFWGTSAASDIRCSDAHLAFNVLKFLPPSSFGQIIFYPGKNFVHISLPTEKHQGERLVSPKSKLYVREQDFKP
jgi:uncharacterized protein YcbK (DUF882 family)